LQAELAPDFIKVGFGFIELHRKKEDNPSETNRDRAIKAVKQSYKGFVSMAIANLMKTIVKDLLKKLN
jgi:hypothetical protein